MHELQTQTKLPNGLLSAEGFPEGEQEKETEVTMENIPEIIINSEGDGKYLLIIGHDRWHGLTLDETLAIIAGKEVELDGIHSTE